MKITLKQAAPGQYVALDESGEILPNLGAVTIRSVPEAFPTVTLELCIDGNKVAIDPEPFPEGTFPRAIAEYTRVAHGPRLTPLTEKEEPS